MPSDGIRLHPFVLSSDQIGAAWKCFQLDGASCGDAIFIEMDHLLAATFRTDRRVAKKTLSKNATLPKLADKFSLNQPSFLPRHAGGHRQPSLILSSKLVITWLLNSLMHPGHLRRQHLHGTGSLLTQFASTCRMGGCHRRGDEWMLDINVKLTVSATGSLDGWQDLCAVHDWFDEAWELSRSRFASMGLVFAELQSACTFDWEMVPTWLLLLQKQLQSSTGS